MPDAVNLNVMWRRLGLFKQGHFWRVTKFPKTVYEKLLMCCSGSKDAVSDTLFHIMLEVTDNPRKFFADTKLFVEIPDKDFEGSSDIFMKFDREKKHDVSFINAAEKFQKIAKAFGLDKRDFLANVCAIYCNRYLPENKKIYLSELRGARPILLRLDALNNIRATPIAAREEIPLLTPSIRPAPKRPTVKPADGQEMRALITDLIKRNDPVVMAEARRARIEKLREAVDNPSKTAVERVEKSVAETPGHGKE